MFQFCFFHFLCLSKENETKEKTLFTRNFLLPYGNKNRIKETKFLTRLQKFLTFLLYIFCVKRILKEQNFSLLDFVNWVWAFWYFRSLSADIKQSEISVYRNAENIGTSNFNKCQPWFFGSFVSPENRINGSRALSTFKINTERNNTKERKKD